MQKEYLRTQNTRYPFHTAYQPVKYPPLATGPIYQGYTPSSRYIEPMPDTMSVAPSTSEVSSEKSASLQLKVTIERSPVKEQPPLPSWNPCVLARTHEHPLVDDDQDLKLVEEPASGAPATLRSDALRSALSSMTQAIKPMRDQIMLEARHLRAYKWVTALKQLMDKCCSREESNAVMEKFEELELASFTEDEVEINLAEHFINLSTEMLNNARLQFEDWDRIHLDVLNMMKRLAEMIKDEDDAQNKRQAEVDKMDNKEPFLPGDDDDNDDEASDENEVFDDSDLAPPELGPLGLALVSKGKNPAKDAEGSLVAKTLDKKLKPLKLDKSTVVLLDNLRGAEPMKVDEWNFDDVVREIKKWGRPIRLDFRKPKEQELTAVFFSLEGPIDPEWSVDARQQLIDIEQANEAERLAELARRADKRAFDKEERRKARERVAADKEARKKLLEEARHREYLEKLRRGEEKMKKMQRKANESKAAWQRRLAEELQRIVTISQLCAVELERAERMRDTAIKIEALGSSLSALKRGSSNKVQQSVPRRVFAADEKFYYVEHPDQVNQIHAKFTADDWHRRNEILRKEKQAQVLEGLAKGWLVRTEVQTTQQRLEEMSDQPVLSDEIMEAIPEAEQTSGDVPHQGRTFRVLDRVRGTGREVFAPKLGLIWDGEMLRQVNRVDPFEVAKKGPSKKSKDKDPEDSKRLEYVLSVDHRHVGMNPVLSDDLKKRLEEKELIKSLQQENRWAEKAAQASSMEDLMRLDESGERISAPGEDALDAVSSPCRGEEVTPTTEQSH